MTWEIALVFLLVLAALGSFVWEKIPTDLTAMALFVILLLTGLLKPDEAFSVFANPAPLTIAAMFILSAALVRSGVIDRISAAVEQTAKWPYAMVILMLVIVVGGISAFINNTPVVVVFLPIVLSLARKMNIAPSKLLIPLSYAAILGGTCTLVGTSTNLLVDGILRDSGRPGFSMFELAAVGLPATIVGALYLMLFGRHLLPSREMLTSILSAEERREYITEAFVQPDSSAVGKTIEEAGLKSGRGIRVLEIVRRGIAIPFEVRSTPLAAGDRLVMSCRPKGIAHTRTMGGIDLVSELDMGLEQIAAHEGSIVEAVVSPHASLVGHTVADVNFRQRYRMVVLALHRRGRNLRDQIATMPIDAGDVLLMMGTDEAIDKLGQGDDFILFDRARTPGKLPRRQMIITVAAVVGVVALAALGTIPIAVGAISAAVLICMLGYLKTRDAYESIEWNLLFLIYGMLAMGLAMDRTGAAKWLAGGVVNVIETFAPADSKAIVLLACLYFVTSFLTEILSNNAVAALMAPLAITLAAQLGLDPRPFVVAVAFGASAAFATPIGYQTNTYVYGVGGYRFSDFLKIGIPLNLVCFVVAMWVIPKFWPLVPLAH